MTNEHERAEFEAICLERHPTATFGRFPISGQYNNDWIEHQWVGYQAGRAALQSQVEASKYKPISVEERLPEMISANDARSVDVLIYTNKGDCHIASFYYGFGKWLSIVVIDNEKELLFLDNVTHWLPIPEIGE